MLSRARVSVKTLAFALPCLCTCAAYILHRLLITNQFAFDRELYSNNLSGPIPGDLGNLTSLVSLDLYMNGFTGPIPDTLGKLSKLRFL